MSYRSVACNFADIMQSMNPPRRSISDFAKRINNAIAIRKADTDVLDEIYAAEQFEEWGEVTCSECNDEYVLFGHRDYSDRQTNEPKYLKDLENALAAQHKHPHRKVYDLHFLDVDIELRGIKEDQSVPETGS